jgi:hypothetical protein
MSSVAWRRLKATPLMAGWLLTYGEIASFLAHTETKESNSASNFLNQANDLLFLLIKKKRVGHLINGNSAKNRYKHS